jgi:N4-gp56 family major capsid protein
MPDVITGNTQVGPTKQEVIAAVALKELKFAASLLSYVTDVSQFAVKGASSISFPKLTSFTVQKRATGVKGDIQALSATKDTLALDERAYIAWLVDTNDAIQTTLDWELESVRRAAAAHGRQVDLDIIVELKAVAGLTLAAGNVTRDKILDAREFLKKNDANMNAVVLAVSPNQESEMLKLSEFSAADVYGQAVIPSGVIGRVYGVPVLVHNGLADGEILMWEKEGCAIGFQRQPAIDEQKEIGYGTGALLKAMDQLYGIQGLQLGEKGLLASQSPLVVKMV